MKTITSTLVASILLTVLLTGELASAQQRSPSANSTEDLQKRRRIRSRA